MQVRIGPWERAYRQYLEHFVMHRCQIVGMDEVWAVDIGCRLAAWMAEWTCSHIASSHPLP